MRIFKVLGSYQTLCLLNFLFWRLPTFHNIFTVQINLKHPNECEHAEDVVSLVKSLKKQKVKVCSIEQVEKTEMLNEFKVDQSKEYALVFGNEVDGVQQDVIDRSNHILEVPQFGTKHSLNVSVCAGVVLWEFVRGY